MKLSEHAVRGLQGCAGLALLAMLIIVTIDVVGRQLLARALPGATELTQYAMAITVFAGLPVVCLHRGHITIGLLDGLFQRHGRRIYGLLVNGACAVVLGMQAWILWQEASWLRELGAVIGYLQLPTYPAAYGMALLSGVAALACAWIAVCPPSSSGPKPLQIAEG